MGHRALVAYERTDGTYNLHYSHWGGCNLRLKHTITEATPFGGECPTEHALQVYDALVSGREVHSVLHEYGRLESTDVDLEPRAIDVTIDEAIEEWLNFLQHEAFYVVDREFEVTAYRNAVVRPLLRVGGGPGQRVRRERRAPNRPVVSG